MNKNDKILILGGSGLVGSSVIRELKKQGYTNLLFPTHRDLELTHQIHVFNFFHNYRPDYVFLCAAKVGGIAANSSYPAQFITANLMIASNVIYSAHSVQVKKLLNLGSSSIYPKNCEQPMREESLMTDKLEPTNEAYTVAKIAAIKMCKAFNYEFGTNFISAIPCNLYGEQDNFDLNNSHFIPGMIRKFHEAKISGNKEVELWGTGLQKREVLYVGDLAEALVFLMNTYNHKPNEELINVGAGKDYSIDEYAGIIKDIVGFKGRIKWNTDKPDGVRRKLLDSQKITDLGWIPKTPLKEGLRLTYKYFINKE